MKSLDFSPTPGTCYCTPKYDQKLCGECDFRKVAKCNYNGWDEKKITEYYEEIR